MVTLVDFPGTAPQLQTVGSLKLPFLVVVQAAGSAAKQFEKTTNTRKETNRLFIEIFCNTNYNVSHTGTKTNNLKHLYPNDTKEHRTLFDMKLFDRENNDVNRHNSRD